MTKHFFKIGDLSVTLLFLFQSVKILTYREPQNPEYKDFVTDLKANAKKMFNFTVEDSLVCHT